MEDEKLFAAMLGSKTRPNSPIDDLQWLSGEHINAVTMKDSHPYAFVNEANGQFEGIFPEIFAELQNQLNFSVTFSFPPSDTYGSKLGNGSFDGLVGVLERREAHVAVADVTFLFARTNVIDYLVPILHPHLVLAVAWPAQGINWYSYFRVFSPEYWTILALTWVGLVLGLRGVGGLPFVSSMAFSASALINKEIDSQPRSEALSLRCLRLTLLALGLMNFSIYNGVLVSFLAAEVQGLPIQSVLQLPESNAKFALQRGTAWLEAFRDSPRGSIWNRIYDTKLLDQSDIFIDGESYERRDTFFDNEYIILYNQLELQFSPRFPCEITQIPGSVFRSTMSFAVPKDSPLTPVFNQKLNVLREAGILDKIIKKYLGNFILPTSRGECPQEQSVSLQGTALLFSVLLSGAVLACLLALIENMVSRYAQ